jgi:ketosteroid isomerase-like protein
VQRSDAIAIESWRPVQELNRPAPRHYALLDSVGWNGQGYFSGVSEQSTTRHLVEMVHRCVEAINRRDVDEFATFFGADSVWDLSPMGLGAYVSVAAIRVFIEDWICSYEEFELALDEVVDLGSGVVFAVVLQDARLVESAGEVHMRYASVNSGGDGLFERITNYTDIDEARAAAKLLAQERANG